MKASISRLCSRTGTMATPRNSASSSPTICAWLHLPPTSLCASGSGRPAARPPTRVISDSVCCVLRTRAAKPLMGAGGGACRPDPRG